MKKFTLLAVSGLMAMAAQAQFNADPATSEVIKKGVSTLDYIVLSDQAVADVEKAGARVSYIGPDAAAGRNLYVWENTFAGTDNFNPRVDMYEGEAISLMVGNVGWSGAGFNIGADNLPGVNLAHLNENTMFHLAYMCPNGNAPQSIAFILFDGDGSAPAKIAVGDSFVDNGATFPTIGAKANDDWQGIDISLGNLKKYWPTFDLQNKANWTGNILSFLAGGVAGQTLALDAIYFYNTGSEDSIQEINGASAVNFVVTGNTVNVIGGNGIELYNVSGSLVKSTEGTTLGISNLPKGVYVAKSGNKAQKIAVK